jgi:gluconolactonase
LQPDLLTSATETPVAAHEFEILDDRFRQCIRTSARVDRLYTGCRWTEGPVYFPALRTLLFSDIPNDRMLKLDEETDTVTVFRRPSDYINGNTVDRQGRLVSCQQGERRVVRTEHDGSLTVLADRYRGKRFNSPNDVVVKSDDSIWFSDPSYGIDSNYEGYKAQSELGERCVYRIDAQSREVRRVADGFVQPNGLAFSMDERRLYIADSGLAPSIIRVFDVRSDGTLEHGRPFATSREGAFDGFRVDVDDRVWTSAGESIHCYDPDGVLLGRILLPERVSNLTFGGPKRNRLFITATSSLYSVLVAVSGAKTV